MQHVPLTTRLLDSTPFAYKTGSSWAVLCFIPKAGSSAWKGLLVADLVRQGYTKMRPNVSAHGQNLPYGEEKPVGLDAAPWLMWVRHPITRLLSGYLDKHPDTWANPLTPKGFATFVKAVTSSQPLKKLSRNTQFMLNQHYQLQSNQCSLNRGAKYQYLRAETMGVWYRRIVCMLSLQQAHHIPLYRSAWQAPCSQPPCCFIRTLDCGCQLSCEAGGQCNASQGRYNESSFGSFQNNNQSGSENLEKWYDDKLAERVNVWARADYLRFGYLPWRPGQRIATFNTDNTM